MMDHELFSEGFPRWEGEWLVHAKTPEAFGPYPACGHGVPCDIWCKACEEEDGRTKGGEGA
jgi:hypothetical protein